jgi:hypothetical protein
VRKVAIAYSSKDQVDLSRQTVPHLLQPTKFDLWWVDGSRTDEGRELPTHYYCRPYYCFGGPDAAIAFKLSTLLASEENYTHIGLAENDVLLQDDWFEETMALFDKGAAEGLTVGAVSPRSYVDRVLIQRDDWAVMLNIGAGFIIFTREAAEIVLRSFRTGHWPTVRYLFAQVSGIDVATYACFGGRDQMVTSDWQFEAQLASHGLAALALTPAKCQMIGQNPPLEQQGLQLTRGPGTQIRYGDDPAFETYRDRLDRARDNTGVPCVPGIIHRDGAGMLFFPHQLGYLEGGPSWQGTSELQWSQGFGPFAYRAGQGGASLSVRMSSSCSFLVSGGVAGARVALTDSRSGFNFAPSLPPDQAQVAQLHVPGGPVPRKITMEMEEGAVFYGVQTADPQMLDATFRFSWDQLPEAK